MVLKTYGEIDLMDEANRIVHRVLDGIAERVQPGATTRELDRWAEATIREAGAVPAFLDYRGYPATLCTSINDVIVHGIPDERPLAEGDIVGVDCGVLYKGYYGDAARTFAVNEVGAQAQKLMDVTRDSLQLAVDQLHPGNRLSDIGHAVQEFR
jgi:methionyl aminopeptidase